MHYHLEVIMPPVDDVHEALNQIMKPFYESGEDEEGNPNSHPFYDFYTIGGQWNGEKVLSKLNKKKLEAFNNELIKKGITVSGIQCGKQTLNPSSQIPVVDDLWREHFPDCPMTQCPLFDNYKGDCEDIVPLGNISDGLMADHVIIAKHEWQNDSRLEVGYMLRDSIYNGVTWQDTKWDTTIKSAILAYEKHLQNAQEDYKKKCLPTDEWLCVTVDYHS